MDNILIILVVLFLIGLIYITASPMPGGDYGVGYAFVFLICGGGFVLFTGLLAWNLSRNNCFDWVEIPDSQRNLLVLFGWIAFVIAIYVSAALRTGKPVGGILTFLNWLSDAKAVYWLPLLILVPSYILLNMEREAGFAPEFVKLLMRTGFVLSVLMSLGALFGYLRAVLIR